MTELKDVVAVSGVRTPMGGFGGTLKDEPVYQLGATAIREAVKRSGVDPKDVNEVIYGNCRQAGNGPNAARSAALFGGIPNHVPAISLNMACPSGMKSVIYASEHIRTGEGEIYIAGGMDSMSTIPYLLKNCRFTGFKMGNRTLEDGWSDSMDPTCNCGMGQTAENLLEKHDVSRQEMDQFALDSHKKAMAAIKEGRFKDEITPYIIPAKGKTPEVRFDTDETPREDTSIEKLAKLPTVFKKDGRVTAGNACGMSDGACALVVMSRTRAKALGAKPLFSIMGHATAAVDARYMGEGPGYSIPLALERAKMTLSDMDLLEVNEAFAVQVLVNERKLKWDRSKLNVNGGAIALGHPTGISGARILITLYNALKQRGKELGVAAICGGGGVTTAMVIRREN